MFIRPHGLYVDTDGNVWVTDGEGPDGKDPNRDGKGHQVFKFSPEGKLLMTLGKAGVAGDGPDTFNMPSAVVVAPNGDIFVGDGHGGKSNARSSSSPRMANSSKRGESGAPRPANSRRPTPWPWTPAAGCLLVTRGTAGSRSSIRTENFSKSGSNSAGRAGCSSTRTTRSTWPTASRTRRPTRASRGASESAAPRMDGSRPSSWRPTLTVRMKA